ncbi:hypothetical protein PTTG_30448, partial [Puccinia triticina 1-1 BBBD Race 1]
MSDQMSDICVRRVRSTTRRIPLFEQNSDTSVQGVLEQRARPLVGLARPRCSRAVWLEQSSDQLVGQPCPSRRRTRLPDQFPLVGLWRSTGQPVGQSCPTSELLGQ